MNPRHEKIDYVEFPSRDLPLTKAFFEKAFGWTFQDYGPEYTAFLKEGLDGGFFQSDKVSTTETGGALIVFYSETLEETQAKVESAGGRHRETHLRLSRRAPFPLHRALSKRVRGVVG